MSTMPPSKQARGTVFVRGEVCKGCSFCLDFCPSHCLEFSRDFNVKGYHYPVLARPEDCSGCDLCGLYCPDFAIFGVKLKDVQKHLPARPPEAVAA
jgi:2-oxoglutarate ferredoxin oxidoreductase subunit delta